MKCPSCNALCPSGPNAKQVRCLKCGHTFSTASSSAAPAARLLGASASPPPAPPPAAQKSYIYQTTLGKLHSQLQSTGGWVATYEFTKTGYSAEQFKALVAAVRSYAKLDIPQLAKIASFDEPSRRLIWKFGKGEDLVPLTSLPLPPSPSAVEFIVESAARCSRLLHAHDMAFGDFHPGRIFVDRQLRTLVLIPDPWLPTESCAAPAAVATMPCVAPEWSSPASSPPDPIRADVYGLGALAWLLLTGESRKTASGLLSDRSPALAGWDAFIDGCCRTHPARRFTSPAEALEALKSPRRGVRSAATGAAGASSIASPTATPASSTRPRKSPSRWSVSARELRRFGAVVGAVAAVACCVAWWTFNRRGPYERGICDTIVRYAERDYSKCRWELIEGTESLGKKLGSQPGQPALELKNVVGWDDDTFWIVGSLGSEVAPIVRYSGKHAKVMARPVADARDGALLRLLSKDKVVCAIREKLIECHEEVLGERGISPGAALVRAGAEICPIAEDNYYLMMPGNHPTEICSRVFKGIREELAVDSKDKKAVVHDTDNTPLRDFPAAGIRHTRAISEGYAVGIEARRIHHGDWQAPKLVRYENGTWYEIRDLPKPDQPVNAAWYACSDGKVEAVLLAAERGYIFKHGVSGPSQTHSVAINNEAGETSLNLIQIWGRSAEQYWVMDDNGTVWEINEGKPKLRIERIVVPNEKIKLHASWVSPTGAVIAITNKYVFRLDFKTE